MDSYVNPEALVNCTIGRAVEWYVNLRGGQNGWTFDEVEEAADALEAVCRKVNGGGDGDASTRQFRTIMLRLHRRARPPFSHCELICDQSVPLCLYKHVVADIIRGGEFAERWSHANPLDAQNAAATWRVCVGVAESVVPCVREQASAVRRIGMCYGQMMLENETRLVAERREVVMESLAAVAHAEETNMAAR
jgi:hypothetical protein